MGPDPSRIAAVRQLLRASQGPFVPKPRLPVIDELVATVLSQHTSDLNSGRAFAQLKAKFPDWEQILAVIREREGRIDLRRLNDLDDQEVEDYLTSLPGVGPKTAACVLVFSM